MILTACQGKLQVLTDEWRSKRTLELIGRHPCLLIQPLLFDNTSGHVTMNTNGASASTASSHTGSHRTHIETGTLSLPPSFPRAKLAKTVFRQLPSTGRQLALKFLKDGQVSIQKRRVVILALSMPLLFAAFPVPLLVSLAKGVQDFLFFPRQQRFNTINSARLQDENDLYNHEFEEETQQLDHQALTVNLDNENKLEGFCFPVPNNPLGVVLFFHGNDQTATGMANSYAQMMTSSGFHCLFCEYPGYGNSTGDIYSELDVFKAATAFFNTMCSMFEDDTPTFVYGSSIGTGIAAYLASENERITKAVLHASYCDLKALSRCFSRWIPSGLIRYDINTHKYLSRFLARDNTRALLLHATGDEIIPYKQSEKLISPHENNHRAYLVTAGGQHSHYLGHNAMLEIDDDAIIGFLQRDFDSNGIGFDNDESSL